MITDDLSYLFCATIRWVWIPDSTAGYLAGWVVASNPADTGKEMVEVVIADTAEVSPSCHLAGNDPKSDVSCLIVKASYPSSNVAPSPQSTEI